MLLGQLERMNGEAMMRDAETARQVTAKILHLIQTQGKSKRNKIQHCSFIYLYLYGGDIFRLNIIILTMNSAVTS